DDKRFEPISWVFAAVGLAANGFEEPWAMEPPWQEALQWGLMSALGGARGALPRAHRVVGAMGHGAAVAGRPAVGADDCSGSRLRLEGPVPLRPHRRAIPCAGVALPCAGAAGAGPLRAAH